MSKPILLVEDEEHDVIFGKGMAFERAEVKNPLLVVGDGREAIAYLNGDGKYCNRDEYPLPASSYYSIYGHFQIPGPGGSKMDSPRTNPLQMSM